MFENFLVGLLAFTINHAAFLLPCWELQASQVLIGESRGVLLPKNSFCIQMLNVYVYVKIK
jgi:hypothetical protein